MFQTVDRAPYGQQSRSLFSFLSPSPFPPLSSPALTRGHFSPQEKTNSMEYEIHRIPEGPSLPSSRNDRERVLLEKAAETAAALPFLRRKTHREKGVRTMNNRDESEMAFSRLRFLILHRTSQTSGIECRVPWHVIPSR